MFHWTNSSDNSHNSTGTTQNQVNLKQTIGSANDTAVEEYYFVGDGLRISPQDIISKYKQIELFYSLVLST